MYIRLFFILELAVSQELKYSLDDIPLREAHKSSGRHGSYYSAVIVLKLSVSHAMISSTLSFNGREIAAAEEFWQLTV